MTMSTVVRGLLPVNAQEAAEVSAGIKVRSRVKTGGMPKNKRKRTPV
jgi:hypothetical protein